ncbi:protein containg PglZ domain [Longilinea arvoryzae]|uniref:Protein containg PglZ domain n=1 Tax=Longilinea arvoryzae TaxID=360412 RepID=A0A0S7BI56_9CHLR|nr:BREX-3 system phosphatase PglZ [Longilinea arvoryzae]GAP13547.1 protein containg PglZ domain [Longilinea arvoryzae]
MIASLRNYFPSHIHPLTLVSDPDRLMAGETLMAELTQRGFQVIQETDPALLRHRMEEARPFTTDHPIILTTTGQLEDLPYDLYQGAYRINLSLHQYFPNLAYPVLQMLSPDQIEILESRLQPVQPLSRQKTINYLLQEVFNADPGSLSQPSSLIAWINDYHHRQSPLPELLRTNLVERVREIPEYREWNIDLLIRDSHTFQDFVQHQWQLSIDQSLSGKQIKETPAGYFIPFSRDPQLQDLVPSLVRQGTLQPVKINNQKELPRWAQPGITMIDVRLQRLKTLLENIENQLTVMKVDQIGWNTWQNFAQDWAETCSLMAQAGLVIQPHQKTTFQNSISNADLLFTNWLQKNYTALGVQRLPAPHHVNHIPHYLAYLHNLGNLSKVVLLVMDCLSLADWRVISPVWTKRHADWRIKTETLLAQIPTITSISRYALISGLRPADFAGEIEHNVPESRAWELFWSREGFSEDTCKLLPLYYDRQIDQQPELQDPRVNFWCLIDDTLDKLAHNATLGAADQQSSLRLWLDPAHEQNSLVIESQLDWYLDHDFSVFIASDHGHVEATGFGQSSEGLLAQTRGKRARIYLDRLAAMRVQDAFASTILWDNDGLLLEQMSALMPAKREAFATAGEVVVTHGGISIDEVIVPFIQITKERK